MSLKTFRLPSKLVGDPAQQIRDFLRALRDVEIVDGRLIENVSVSTSPTNISHRLGRDWKGYIVTAASASVNVYHTTTTNRDSVLTLTASGSATVSLWVF